METSVNYFRLTENVKKSLADLDKKIRRDKSYLSSKLRNANDDQMAFYDFFLASRNLNDFLERYYALFQSSATEDEDYENLKYYVNNLKYFSPSDPVARARYMH